MKIFTRGWMALSLLVGLALTSVACGTPDDTAAPAAPKVSSAQACTTGAPQCLGAIANQSTCGPPSWGFRCWFESQNDDGSASCSCSANPQ